MVGRVSGGGWCCLVSLSDPVSSTGTGSLIPLPSRERGNWLVILSCCPALHLWIAGQVRNDGIAPTLWFPAYAGMTVWRDCLAVTLTFNSSPIKGEGILSVVLACCPPHPALWIPAYAGMTVRDTRTDRVGCGE